MVLHNNKEKKKIAILGDSSTQYWKRMLEEMGRKEQILIEIYDAPYNQIEYEIYQLDSKLYQFEPNYIILFMCTEKMYERFCTTSYERRHLFAKLEGEKICNYWTKLSKEINVQIIQMGFIEYNDKVFGNFAYKLESSFIYQLKALNMYLINEAIKNSAIFYFDIQNYCLLYGRNYIKESYLYYNAKFVFNLDTIKKITYDLIQYIKVSNGKCIKCLVIDLDDTIWGGCVADLGPFEIQIGDEGMGLVYKEIQRWLKEIQKRGILLAVCSKNNLEDAQAPFIQNKEMILELDDFVLFIANWVDKASNILEIQQKLNIGLESIAFLDNSEFERRQVASILPTCNVIDLPKEPEKFLQYLEEINLFETIAFSEDDLGKTKQYKINELRTTNIGAYSSYEEYLKSLDISIYIYNYRKEYCNRILQLIQKTNQFNMRSIRYNQQDIEKMCFNKGYIIKAIRVHDKYGSRGIVGVIILKRISTKTMFIDTFLLSCRAFKMGIEDAMLNEIIKIAKLYKAEYVLGEYIANERNYDIEKYYLDRGFRKWRKHIWFVKVKQYKKKEVYIKKIYDE